MTDDREGLWASIQDLTQTMHDKAQDGDWTAVLELETQRRAHILEFFNRPASPDESAWLAQAITRLVDDDRRLMARANGARDQVRQQLGALVTGRRARAAYHANSR